MKKLSTLFKKNTENLGLVIDEINPENKWVFDGEGIATRKYDGTACAIINGELYRRYDAKHGKKAPENAIPCQEPDLITGHHPHWIKCDRENKQDKYHFEAFDLLEKKEDATYELIGEKMQGNPEKIEGHVLVKHGEKVLIGLVNPMTFENLKKYLENVDIEGIVFHHNYDGRMCKLRKSDFGIKR